MTLRLVRGSPTTLATAVKQLLLALARASAGVDRAGVEDNRQAEISAAVTEQTRIIRMI
jgi:hypothetical protein